MKKLLAIIVILFLLCTMLPCMAETTFTRDDVIAAALTELTVDGELTADVLTDATRYRTITLYNDNPEERSIRGETWYVRFDAIDKENDDSYIVALNEDLTLRYLDIALCDTALAQCPSIDFAGILDQYRDRYGSCDSWPADAWMAFTVDMCKGRPNGRNAWRIQHATFIPEPERAIGYDEARRLAVLACGDEKLTAYACTCLQDGDRMIYRLGVSEGMGWLFMVENDCLTGETISVTPFDSLVNNWLDCYIPQSLVNVIPAAEMFVNIDIQNSYAAAEPSAAVSRGINPHSFNGTDKGVENDSFALAPADAMTADAAYQLALQALSSQFEIAAETLQAYDTSFGYRYAPTDFSREPYWQFDIDNPNDPLDGYEIILDAQSGEVLYTCGPGEGND